MYIVNVQNARQAISGLHRVLYVYGFFRKRNKNVSFNAGFARRRDGRIAFRRFLFIRFQAGDRRGRWCEPLASGVVGFRRKAVVRCLVGVTQEHKGHQGHQTQRCPAKFEGLTIS